MTDDRPDCRYRCSGTVTIQAVGTDADGRPAQLGTCDRCGRVSTIPVAVDPDTNPPLFDQEETTP